LVQRKDNECEWVHDLSPCLQLD